VRLRAFAAIVAIGLFLARSAIASPDPIAPAIELRDQKHDLDGARAILDPIANGPTSDAAGRDAAARAHYLLGDLDERVLKYASALDHYRAVLTIDPGNWYAATARARSGTLERYQNAFDALAKLDAVRKDPTKANDRASVDAIAAEAASMAAPVRDEALVFVAEAYVGRLNDPARAIDPALLVAHDASASQVDRATGFEIAYAAMKASGAWDRVRAEILADPTAPKNLVSLARRELRRRTLDRIATSVTFIGVAGLIVAAIETIRRRRVRIAFDALRSRGALTFLALVVGGGYFVAEQWQRDAGAPFVFLGVWLLAVHVLSSAWRGGFGDRRRALRIAGGVLAAVCVLAAAWRVLERGGAKTTAMLDEVGL
jgi:tetratricopeptide (TPR) repeat protein